MGKEEAAQDKENVESKATYKTDKVDKNFSLTLFWYGRQKFLRSSSGTAPTSNTVILLTGIVSRMATWLSSFLDSVDCNIPSCGIHGGDKHSRCRGEAMCVAAGDGHGRDGRFNKERR